MWAQRTPSWASSAPIAVRCSAIRVGETRSDLVAIATRTGPPGQRGDLADQVAVARADPLVGRQADPDHVDLGPGGPDDVVEPLPEQGPRLVQARGVDQHQLGVGPVHDPAHRVPGGLRLGRGDRDLAADQGVGQGRLAGVRPADEAGEPGAEASRALSRRRSALTARPRTGRRRGRRRARPRPRLPAGHRAPPGRPRRRLVLPGQRHGLQAGRPRRDRHRHRDLDRGQVQVRRAPRWSPA